MVDEKAVEMFVGGLLLDRNTQAPVVILRDEKGEMTLPIWIGIAEATSIASALNQIPIPRPLTHDLIIESLTQLQANIQRVIITDLKESTYFSELVIATGDKVIILDARPSDAIALALRAHAPIFVAQGVLDKTQATIVNSPPEGTPVPIEGQDPRREDEATTAQKHDFTAIDKEKWQEILNSLEADDFKYKM